MWHACLLSRYLQMMIAETPLCYAGNVPACEVWTLVAAWLGWAGLGWAGNGLCQGNVSSACTLVPCILTTA